MRNPRRSHDAHQKKRKKKKPPPLSTPESNGNTIELNDLHEEAYEPPKQRLNRVPSGSARQTTPTRHRSEEILTRASKVQLKLARRRATREMVASSSDLLRSEQSPRPQSPGTPLDGPRPEGASTKIAPPTREESDAIFNILDVDKGERRDSGCGGRCGAGSGWVPLLNVNLPTPPISPAAPHRRLAASPPRRLQMASWTCWRSRSAWPQLRSTRWACTRALRLSTYLRSETLMTTSKSLGLNLSFLS